MLLSKAIKSTIVNTDDMLISNIQYVFSMTKLKKDLQFMIIIITYVESTIYQPYQTAVIIMVTKY